MKNKIKILAIFLIILTFGYAKSNSKFSFQADKETIVTYTIFEQSDGQKQIIKFVLQVKQNDPSLVIAIEEARQLQAQLKEIFSQFCHTYSPVQHQDNCEEFVQTGQFDIKAQYYHLRGQQAFKTFVVKFQMEFTSTAVDQIGILIDQFSDFMQDNKVILGKISWEDMTDDIQQEKFIDQGVQKASTACANLGLKFHKIKSLQVYKRKYSSGKQEQKKKKQKPKKEEEGDEQQQQQQQQQEDQNNEQQQLKTKYKFVVVCKPEKKVKAKKGVKSFINLVKKNSKSKKKPKLLTE